MRKTLLIVILSFLGLHVYGQKAPVLDGKSKLEGYTQHEKMRAASPYDTLHWQFIGPANISGRCTDVEAVGPKGQNYTIWVASASGGIWKSINEGVTFKPVFDNYGTSSIGDIAIAPSNTDVVWAGTGEANIFRSSNAGCGVWKTTDGGESWTHMGLENTYTISRIIIHPRDPDIVYVASAGHEWTKNRERGLYKTTDGGETWDHIKYIDDETGIIDLVMHPEDPETLYATSWQRTRLKWNDPRTYENHENNHVWKTTDGGKNWERINNGLPETRFRGRMGIDISRSDPDVMYLLIDNYDLAYKAKKGELDNYGRQKKDVIKGAAIFKTENGGESWFRTSGLTEETKKFMENHSATYGWVFGQIRVDPNDPNTIYSLGIWLNQSFDGGGEFSAIRSIHADHHGMWIDPDNSNYILSAHDGGISVSYDQGKNWRSLIKELPLAQFYNVEYDNASPFRVYGSIQDHHSFYSEVDMSRGRDRVRPTEWEYTLGAEGSSHIVDKRDNNTILASLFYGKLAKATVDGYPDDMRYVLPGRYPEEKDFRGQWMAPTIFSPQNPDIVYHGVQYVMRSSDLGETWRVISPDLTFNDPDKIGDISYQTITSIDVSPFRSELIYAGTDDGRIWRTKNGGETWNDIREKPMPERWVSRIVASTYDMGTLYVTQTGRRDDDAQVYIWRSEDYGDNWQDISSNIPVGPINVIREDPVNKKILYAGTDVGVYVSLNRGESWQVLGDLPCTYVHDLKIHPRDNMIIIATHGRGMFVLDADRVNKTGGNDQRGIWED
ncbi:MAG: hypothetical protein K9J30_05210 [Bacteroidales bacterium]|nr:hypothetical protein [Bacteroidales bacterium]